MNKVQSLQISVENKPYQLIFQRQMSEQYFSGDQAQTGIDYNYVDYCNQKEIIFSQWVQGSDQSNLDQINKRLILQHCDDAWELIRIACEKYELSKHEQSRLKNTRKILQGLNDENLDNLRIITIQQITRIAQMLNSQNWKANKLELKIIEQCNRAQQLMNSFDMQQHPQRDYEWEILAIKSHLERFPEIYSTEIQRSAQLVLEDLNRLSANMKKKYNKPEAVTQKVINEDELCRICYQHTRSYATVPCGHLIYCEKCKDHVRNMCMMCRQPVIEDFLLRSQNLFKFSSHCKRCQPHTTDPQSQSVNICEQRVMNQYTIIIEIIMDKRKRATKLNFCMATCNSRWS